MSATDYLEGLVLNHLVFGQTFSVTPMWVGLFISDPTSSGSLVGEVSVGEYARLAVNFDSGWNNSNELLWGPSSETWGNVSYVALLDSSSSGSMIAYGSISVINFTAFKNVRISTGQLTLSVT